MPIISFLLFCAVIGLICWLLVTFIPMPQQIKTIIVVAAVIFIVLILLQATGLLEGIGTIPRVR